MSLKLPYRKEITLNGKTYIRGPALPASASFEDKCAVCAGSSLGACVFGHDCLHIASLYWIEKPAACAGAAEAPARMSVCAKCGKRRRQDRMASVVTGAGASEEWCAGCAEKHALTCECCGRACVPDQLEGVTGSGQWCPDCIAERAARCGHCGVLVPTGTLADVHPANLPVEHWCHTCTTALTVVCGHCGQRVLGDGAVNVDGSLWCAGCSAEHSTACSRCGRRTATLYPDPDTGEHICNSCRASRSAGIVLDYHGMRGTALKFWGAKHESTPLYLGFELEAGEACQEKFHMAAIRTHAIDPQRQHYHLERDGSIPVYGFELVSAPHTLEAHKEFGWEKVVKAMSGNGLKSHDCGGRCGLHVHVSRNFFSEKNLAGLDAFVLRNKTFWERVARRTQSDYARYVNKPDSDFGRCAERYCAVNFRPSETVEFRLFRGTLKFSTLMATLEVVDAVCRWVKTRSTDQLLKNCGEVDRFVAWMGEAERAETYKNALAYVVERRAVEDANSGTSGVDGPDL